MLPRRQVAISLENPSKESVGEMRVFDPISYLVYPLQQGDGLNTDYILITMNARFVITLIISTLFVAIAAGQSEESAESRGSSSCSYSMPPCR